MILLVVLAINFIGDGLRDALDPRSDSVLRGGELVPDPILELAT